MSGEGGTPRPGTGQGHRLPGLQAVIAIYRYYDVDSHLLGEGKRAGMETYGWGLGRLIVDLLKATKSTGVYLVAHSMGECPEIGGSGRERNDRPNRCRLGDRELGWVLHGAASSSRFPSHADH